MSCKISFLTLILFYTFSNKLSAQSINGTVYDSVKSEVIPYAAVFLFDTNSVSAKKTINADLEGHFKFDTLSSGIYSVKIYCIGYRTMTFSNINLNGDTTISFNIHTPCKYDGSLRTKICPVCHKTDSVIPIEYGLLIIEKKVNKRSKKEIKKSEEPMDDFFPGGCMITDCDPHWYCKRDKEKF